MPRQGSLTLGLRWISGQNRDLQPYNLPDIILLFPIASGKGRETKISVHIPDLVVVLLVFVKCVVKISPRTLLRFRLSVKFVMNVKIHVRYSGDESFHQ